MSLLGLGLSLSLIVSPAVPGPAAPCVAEALPRMAEAATRADSMALGQHFLASPPGGDQNCGRLLAGVLLGLTSTPAEDAWRDRQRAAELIEQALRSFGDEPRLYLAMAVVLHHRQSRTDALRMLERAWERADKGEVPLSQRERAVLHYVRGVVHQDFWRDWRSYGQIESVSQGQWRCSQDQDPTRDNFSSSSSDFSWLIPVNQLCPERFSENMDKYFIPRRDMNADAREAAEQAFAEAWDADPTFMAPAVALFEEAVYQAEWGRADSLARLMEEHYPDNVWVRLYRGLVYHEQGRDSLAALTFAGARPDLPDSLAAAFDDITILLNEAQQQAVAAMDTNTQQQLRVAFWTSMDPIYLTTWNERRLEHASRVVTAALLFSGTALEGPGWNTYAGQIWVRYGRPTHIWELQVPAGRLVFWDFGPGPDFSFIRGFGYRGYRPTDEARQYGNALGRATANSYAPTTLVDSIVDLDVQVVRALGPELRPQLLVYAEWPERAADTSRAGLTLLDGTYFPVAQWRGTKPTRPGIGAELNGLAGGGYSLTVEVWDQAARRLYQLRDTVSTVQPGETEFAVSDLLLVTEIRAPENDITSRRALPVTPLYGSTLRKGEALGLVWETYRLDDERDGRQEYRVSIELLDAARQPMLARVLRGVGIGDRPRPEAKIEFDSSRPLADGRTVEWLELTSDLDIGEYRLVFTIRDRRTGTEVTRERAIRVR